MNNVWTVLSGADVSAPRRTTPAVYNSAAKNRNLLSGVLNSQDLQYNYFTIERLVRCGFDSPLRADFETLDPVNTYKYPLVWSAAVLETYPAVPPMKVSFLDKFEPNWMARTIICTVKPASTLTDAGTGTVYPFTVTNNLSSIMTVDQVPFRLLGALPAVEFTFTISAVVIPKFDINAILGSLEEPFEWISPKMKETWLYGEPTERLAAYIYSMTATCLK
jgi:hypothetical protein